MDKSKRYVISSVCGAKKISVLRRTVEVFLTNICKIVNMKTDYYRKKYIFNNAAKIICLNNHEKKYLHKMYRIDNDDICIVSNGVDSQFWMAKKGFPAVFL